MKVSMIVSARRFRSGAYRVKANLGAADVGSTHGDYVEKAIAPLARECDASLSTNRFWGHFAMHGNTENGSPGAESERRMRTTWGDHGQIPWS